jgi:hypothetical protein
MALVNFSEELEAADSVLDLARRLGDRCLQSRAELETMSDDERTRDELDLIEQLAGRASYATWEEVVHDPTQFEVRMEADLAAAVKRAKIRQPLDYLGVLRGLCRGPLQEFFTTIAGKIELTKGVPVLFASRPLPEALGDDATTTQETLKDGDLLFPLPFDLYTHIPAEELRVVLDFSSCLGSQRCTRSAAVTTRSTAKDVAAFLGYVRQIGISRRSKPCLSGRKRLARGWLSFPS